MIFFSKNQKVFVKKKTAETTFTKDNKLGSRVVAAAPQAATTALGAAAARYSPNKQKPQHTLKERSAPNIPASHKPSVHKNDR